MIKYLTIGFLLFIEVHSQGGLETFAGLNIGKSAGGKTYYVSKFITNDWVNAYSFCYNSNMTLVTLDDLTEANDFLAKVAANKAKLPGVSIISVGMVAKQGTNRASWNFYKSGKPVGYAIPFARGFPDTSSFADCLVVEISSGGVATFKNGLCFQRMTSFACQA